MCIDVSSDDNNDNDVNDDDDDNNDDDDDNNDDNDDDDDDDNSIDVMSRYVLRSSDRKSCHNNEMAPLKTFLPFGSFS